MKALIGGLGLTWLFLILSSIGAWGTHVVVCIQAKAWILLIVGALAAPVGVVHGWMVWFGNSML